MSLSAGIAGTSFEQIAKENNVVDLQELSKFLHHYGFVPSGRLKHLSHISDCTC